MILRNLQTIEPVIALVLDVKESVQHGKIHALTEATGPDEQVCAPVILREEILYQQALVNIVFVAITNILKLA